MQYSTKSNIFQTFKMLTGNKMFDSSLKLLIHQTHIFCVINP